MSGRKRKEFWHSNQANYQGSHPNSAHASGQRTPNPYSSSQPNADPDQIITDPHFIGQPTPDHRRITGPYRTQRSHVPQPTPYPSFSSQATPNQQHNTDPYGGQTLPHATPGSHIDPYYSSQPTSDLFLSDQSFIDPRFIGQPTLYQQSIADPYGGQPIPHAASGSHIDPYYSRQPASDPLLSDQFIGQPALYQQRIADPYGGQPIPHATSSGHPGLYYGSQPTSHPLFSDQSIIDSRFIGQPTPYQQRIADSFPGGQRTLDPRSSGQSTPRGQLINDGTYIITNEYHHRFVYLEDPNDTTPLKGHFKSGNRNAQWHVRSRGNEQYSIESVEHNRYADSGNRAVVKAHVEGTSEERLWRIQALGTGEYTISTTDTRKLWMLPSDGPDTPVELSNVYTDRRCRWTFNSAETVVPVAEDTKIQPALSDPTLLLAPSGAHLIPESVVIEFASVTAEARDLLQPLGAACRALRIVLQKAESIGQVNEDRTALIKRLKFHLATVESDISNLEEDQNIDKTIPAVNQDVRESLETYARELKETYELLSDNQTSNASLANKVTNIDHNKGIIVDKTRKIDEAFQRYTAALHQFAANTVAEMRQQLAQFRPEFQQGVHTAAEKALPNRPNAYGIQHRECLPGTREKTLPAISDWADDENTQKWIFFFLDVAGSGKSTVAKHMAKKWKEENRLLGRFFFSRDTTETMSTNSFCSTVANSFSVLDPEFKKHLDEFTKRPDLGLLPFEESFEGQVVGPLRAIGRDAILIIDALDECHPGQRDQLLQTLLNQHSSIPLLRIFVTGRPEPDIKRWADGIFGFGYTNFIRLEESDKDVELYIEHRLRDLPIGQGRLYPVIRRAEGLFIWARIACDLLTKTTDIDALLLTLSGDVSLDYLYQVALEQSIPKDTASHRATIVVLQMILAARSPLSIAELEDLFPKRAIVAQTVDHLSSLLLYRHREDPIRLLHTTVREFLTSRSKAGAYHIQSELGHLSLASGCLNVLDHHSRETSDIDELSPISKRKVVLHHKICIDVHSGLLTTLRSHGHIIA